MKNFINEFKTFIARGNVMDMAVGIIIGSGFTAIVNSLVDDIIMPLLSLITGGFDFTALSVPLGTGEGAATLNYGSFIGAVIDFLLIAFVIFWMMKAMNKLASLRGQTEEAAPTTKTCPYCKEEVAIDAVKCPHCTSNLM